MIRTFFVVELVCVSWFIIELLLRFVSCPSKRSFCRDVMNIFDVLAIVPFFVTVATMQVCINNVFSFLLHFTVFQAVLLVANSMGFLAFLVTFNVDDNDDVPINRFALELEVG